MELEEFKEQTEFSSIGCINHQFNFWREETNKSINLPIKSFLSYWPRVSL